jgi:hypothetical protein
VGRKEVEEDKGKASQMSSFHDSYSTGCTPTSAMSRLPTPYFPTSYLGHEQTLLGLDLLLLISCHLLQLRETEVGVVGKRQRIMV